MSLKDAIRIADAERKQPESNKAVKPASSEAVNTASGKTVKPADAETPAELANLTVRVPKSHRVHWLICAKKEGTSLTAAVTEAMIARYGKPDAAE